MDRKKKSRSPRNSDGEAFLVCGSRGSGKSTWTVQQIPAAAELLVWDTVGQWSRRRGDRNGFGMCTPVHTLTDLHALIISGQRLRLGYCGPISKNHFDVFCKLAWVWIRCGRGRILVVEELSDVTSPAKAPDGWGEIVRKGRHEGGSIYALTQRPAESDKTIAGNADVIHAGRLSFPGDRKTLAEYLDVPVGDITALPSLAFIERDMRTRELRTGTVQFR